MYKPKEGYIYTQNEDRRNQETKWEMVWEGLFNFFL